MSIARLIPVMLCSAALVGCEGASEPEFNVADPALSDLEAGNVQNGNPFVGSWRLESIVSDDDAISVPQDALFILDFSSELDLLWSVSGDVGHLLCEAPETNCTVAGSYSYTKTTLTMDEQGGPEPGPDTGLYTFFGGRLVYMDFAGEGGLRVTFVRGRRDCDKGHCD